MSDFPRFLRQLLREGDAVLHAKPAVPLSGRQEAVDLLAGAFRDYRLAVAGPPVGFEPEAAVAAGELVWHACWFLLQHGEDCGEVERLVRMPGPPRSPAEHLSADLTLRYLPPVYRRARATAADDILTARLTHVLREWPLSGVLSDVADGPLTKPDFAGHAGLLLLYAERLGAHPRPEWMPAGSVAREYVELVSAEAGRRV
jgi:hypothetical protein